MLILAVFLGRVGWEIYLASFLAAEAVVLILLAAEELPAAPGADVRSLVPLMLGDEREHRPAWMRITPHAVFPDSAIALRTGTHKLIAKLTDPSATEPSELELYDLRSDPDELQNRSEKQP